jgi:hypothetical protein
MRDDLQLLLDRWNSAPAHVQVAASAYSLPLLALLEKIISALEENDFD